jgi:hypothetical protein
MGYDAFFKDPARGLIEVGCWAHYLDSEVIQRNRFWIPLIAAFSCMIS